MSIPGASTMATGLLLGTVALALAFLLTARRRPDQNRTARLWAAALLFSGIAAFAAGAYNRCCEGLAGPLATSLWKAAMAAIGLSAFCFVAGSAFATVRGKARRLVLAAAGGQAVLYLLWIIGHSASRYAVFDYVPAMIAVLAMHAHAWSRRRDPAAPWAIGGVALSLVGGVFHLSGVDVRAGFGHSEIYNLTQVVGIYCFFRSGRVLTDLDVVGAPDTRVRKSTLQP